MKVYLTALIMLFSSTCMAASTQRIATVDEAANRAAEITQRHRLSTDPIRCLLFDVSDRKRFFMVGVHEKHSSECGGDPGTAPALFFMKIRKRDGYVVTNHDDGEHFRPLPAGH